MNNSEVETFPETLGNSTVMAAMPSEYTTVVAGTVSNYLMEANDTKIYKIDLPSGVYLQAQLTTPANENLNYDLYLLDKDGNILTGSDYYTNINGTSGTLPEALGYITSGDTATYYLCVLSSTGGSVSEAFTYGTEGAYINYRNLSSPIDNDWYVITVPSSRIYNKLYITASTSSANTCSVEIYQNITSDGYKMKRIGSGNTILVSTGTYYVRILMLKQWKNLMI